MCQPLAGNSPSYAHDLCSASRVYSILYYLCDGYIKEEPLPRLTRSLINKISNSFSDTVVD